MSLTTTTVRQLGSFELVSTKETPLRAPRNSQSHGSLRTQFSQSPSFQDSLNSFDSELSVVREEPELFDHIVDSPLPQQHSSPAQSPQRGRERARVIVASPPTTVVDPAPTNLSTPSPLVNVTTALDVLSEGDETEGDTTVGSYAEPETTAEQITELENQLRLENLPDGAVGQNGQVLLNEPFLSSELASRSRSRSPMKPALRERNNSTTSNASERERRNTHVSFETVHTEEYVYDAYDYEDYDEADASTSKAAAAPGESNGTGPAEANGRKHATTVAAAATAAAKAKQQRDMPSPAQRQVQRRAAQAAAAARTPKPSAAAPRTYTSSAAAASAAASNPPSNSASSTQQAQVADSEGDSVYSDAEDDLEVMQQRRPTRQGLEQKQLNGRPNPPADSPAARALAAAAAISNGNGHLATSVPRRSSLRNSQIYKREQPVVDEDEEGSGHHYRALLDDASSIQSDSSFKRERSRAPNLSTPTKADNVPTRNPQRMPTTLRSQDRRSSLTGTPTLRSQREVPGSPSTPTAGFRSYSLRNQARPDPAKLMADANAHSGEYDLSPPAARPGGGLYSLRGDAPNTRGTRRSSVNGPISAPSTPSQATRFVSRFSRDSDSEDEAFSAAISSIAKDRSTDSPRVRTGFKSMFMVREEERNIKTPQRYSSAPEPRQKRGFFKRLFSRT